MKYTKVDDNTFTTEADPVVTTYSLSDLNAELVMLNQRVAQIIGNHQTQAKLDIQPSLDRIAAITALLVEAGKGGIDTTTTQTVPDTSAIVASLSDVEQQSAALSTTPEPIVVELLSETPPIVEPTQQEPTL